MAGPHFAPRITSDEVLELRIERGDLLQPLVDIAFAQRVLASAQTDGVAIALGRDGRRDHELENRLRRGDTGLPLVDPVRLLVDVGCPESRPLHLRPDERALRHMHFERRARIQVPQLAGRQLVAIAVEIDLADGRHDTGGSQVIANFPTQVGGTR